MLKWVAKLLCGHVVGDTTPVVPESVWCPECQSISGVDEAITNAPLRGPDGKSW